MLNDSPQAEQSNPSGRFAHPVVLGAGPVGTAIVEALVLRGLRPTVVTRSGAAVAGAQVRQADLADRAEARQALDDATIVFTTVQPEYHRWAQEFPALQASIVQSCVEIGVPLMVIENLYAYGELAAGEAMTESSPMQPSSKKGRVRLAMWRELEAAAAAGQLDMAVVRASDFFGPGVEGSAFGSRFFAPLAKGKPASSVGAVDVLHSITFVPDLAEAIVRVAEDDSAWGRAWHAPSAPAVTQNQIAEIAAASVGHTGRAKSVPVWLLRMLGLFMPPVRETIEMFHEFDRDFVMDSTAFTAHFGMEPTPLEQSLAAVMKATT